MALLSRETPSSIFTSFPVVGGPRSGRYKPLSEICPRAKAGGGYGDKCAVALCGRTISERPASTTVVDLSIVFKTCGCENPLGLVCLSTSELIPGSSCVALAERLRNLLLLKPMERVRGLTERFHAENAARYPTSLARQQAGCILTLERPSSVQNPHDDYSLACRCSPVISIKRARV